MNKDKIKDALRQALKKDHSSINQKRPKRTPILVVIVMCLLILGLQYSTTFFSSGSGTHSSGETSLPSSAGTIVVSDTTPQGKILLPAAGTITGHEVSVICETKNLEPGTCVWLAVDKPDIGLCRPKGSSIPANTKIQTTIYEGGPKEQYRLSLYALNENYNTQWQDWIDRKIFGGLPMPPDSKRLASVTLILGH
ncbi:MAG: hypothetical protein KAR45_21765 [Desulfobacteraceae bacterium]|nr:hypothetical protein [Desulfobacteraceae bacterium]